MSISTNRKKPAKPYRSFPLTAHNNGQWCKKIRGKIHFFGVWANPQAALDNYHQIAADLHAGRQPSYSHVHPNAFTVKDAGNQYLNYQFQKVQRGEIRASTFDDCRSVAESFARIVGSSIAVADLSPADFQKFRSHIAKHGLTGSTKGLGIYAQARSITIVKSMFRYAYENDLIDKPMKFGDSFTKPSATLKRRARKAAELENGKRLFKPHQIKAMLEHAVVPLRSMILLGLNGGFGNTDCAKLPIKAIDFGRKVIDFDRPKTGIERVVPLWPETIAALLDTISNRPQPVDEEASKLVFLTTFGRPWVREHLHLSESKGIDRVVVLDAIGDVFDRLLIKLDLKRKGLSFYALRHTFRTWADEVRDQHAIHKIMGHAIPGMSGIYVEEIGLDRLRVIVEHVRNRIFG